MHHDKNHDQASPARETTESRTDDIANMLEIPLWRNFITIAGLYITILAIVFLLTFGLFSVITPASNPYVDIIGFLVLPCLLIGGVLIIPLGILIKSWRVHRQNPKQRLVFRFPHFDLNDPLQRRTAKFIVGLTFIMLPVVGVSGYHGYHYTDSVRFCARTCHSVMKPQATTYTRSPHARVSCAECHIGEGAGWFVKSKLSGTRQVFATLWDTYPRPIPPAISQLRPARETCERCHWPAKFYGAQLVRIADYATDEHNTRREIDMLLKIGGSDESAGPAEGIHKHMALSGRVEYVATDENLQHIPWVKWTDSDGNELIYRSDGRPSSDPIPEGRLRQFDCMDCHNRPAHKFRAPERSVDIFLDVGRIDTTLPYIKREAVHALVQDYPDEQTAHAQIKNHLSQYYRENYPEVWERRLASVNQAVDMVREIYSSNFFPEMKVDWQTYPDNIGHKISAGCFRCHDGRHVNQAGQKISYECNICHTFLNPVEQEHKSGIIQEGEFVHSPELEGLHAQLLCHQCHTGGMPPQPTCAGCHSKIDGLLAASLPRLRDYAVEKSAMYGFVDCESCHDLSEPMTLESVDVMCMECHDDEPEKYVGLLARWSDNVAQKRKRVDAQMNKVATRIREIRSQKIEPDSAAAWLQRAGESLQILKQAGPLHNYEAAMRIYDTLISESQEQISLLNGGG